MTSERVQSLGIGEGEGVGLPVVTSKYFIWSLPMIIDEGKIVVLYFWKFLRAKSYTSQVGTYIEAQSQL